MSDLKVPNRSIEGYEIIQNGNYVSMLTPFCFEGQTLKRLQVLENNFKSYLESKSIPYHSEVTFHRGNGRSRKGLLSLSAQSSDQTEFYYSSIDGDIY